jgi:hypothetical protein
MTYYSGRLLIERNEISNAGSGIYLKANFPTVGSITVRYNHIHDIEDAAIDIHRNPTTADAPTLIYQNLIRNSDSGIQIHAFDSGNTDPQHTKIVNNTLINNNRQLFLLYPMRDNARHVFWNNVMSGGNLGVYMEAPAANLVESRIDIEHNVYNTSTVADVGGSSYSLSNWKSTFGMDLAQPASLVSNLLFLDLLTNFKLLSNSPARNVGVDILDLDRDGSTTDVIPAGAYITGNEVIGRGAIPLAPTQVTVQ